MNEYRLSGTPGAMIQIKKFRKRPESLKFLPFATPRKITGLPVAPIQGKLRREQEPCRMKHFFKTNCFPKIGLNPETAARLINRVRLQ